MKRDLILDFNPIKDGTWNMTPFHSDYVPPQRKSSPIDPYELMPVYRAYDADPAAPLPKPKTRAVTGLDDFGEGKKDMYDLVHQTSDHGLTRSIGDEFNLADPPHRKRIRDNVANAQDWWQGANDDQIKDQNYAANFAKAARSARNSDDDHAGFGSVQSTALKHSVKPMELHDYINGGPDAQAAILADMNNRIMPWAPGTPLVQLPDPNMGYAPVDGGNAFGADDGLTDLWADNTGVGAGDPNTWRPGMLQPIDTDDETAWSPSIIASSDEQDLEPEEAAPGNATALEPEHELNDPRYRFMDEERVADGHTEDPRPKAHDFVSRYGNFGGRHWTNGVEGKGTRVVPTDHIDTTGKNKLEPIDALDAAFMHHDHAYMEADDAEKAGNKAAATARWRESDLALLAKLKKLQRQFLAKEIKLGIDGEGSDTRASLLKRNSPVSAQDMLKHAIFIFTLKTQDNGPGTRRHTL